MKLLHSDSMLGGAGTRKDQILLVMPSFLGGTQIWRLFTHAAFLGKIGISFLFNVFWL